MAIPPASEASMKRRKLIHSESDSGEDESDLADEEKHSDGRRARRRKVHITSLVVNGKAAAPGQFPHQVGLIVNTEHGVARCGGVLLSDRWLLTAAHCCRKGMQDCGSTSVRVFLGSYPTMMEAEQTMVTSLVMMHPQYSRERPGHYDLALIRLPRPVRFSAAVKPVRLPSWRNKKDDFAGLIATLSGWGKTSDEDDRPSRGTAVLRYVRERVLGSEEAEQVMGRQLPPYFICARGLQGEVSCNGDSGGPLTVEGPNGSPMLVGVVSHRYALSCNASRAHVCTRVTSFLPWIASVSRVSIDP